MKTFETESIGEREISNTTVIPDFAKQIEESRRINKIREKLEGALPASVLKDHPDFFGIREDDENVINAEFEVMQ